MGIVFREARLQDATELVSLLAELGYPVAPEVLRARLARVLEDGTQLALCAGDPRVLGFLHALEERSVLDEPCARIVALVVTGVERGRGLGRGLIHEAEAWARARGLIMMRVRSRVGRKAAHRFYAAVGYAERKRQVLFGKPL